MGYFLRQLPALFGAVVAMFTGSFPASAHAFGARYDLPLPLEYYLAAAGATVALSFVMMAIAFDSRAARAKGAWIDIVKFAPVRLLTHPLTVLGLKVLSAGLFCLVIAAGFFGNQDPIKNFAPTFIWIIWRFWRRCRK